MAGYTYKQVCYNCGSESVARLKWVNVNDDKTMYDGDTGTTLEWCFGKCQSETEIVDKDDYVPKADSDDDVIYEVKEGDLFKPSNFPIGTKYTSFDPERHLKLNQKVHAKKFAGKTTGRITEILDNEICRIDGEATFISDIVWTIIE